MNLMQRPGGNPRAGSAVWRNGALVIGAALAASLAGLWNTWAFDDIHLIAQNARVHSLGQWRELLTSPFWPPPFSPDLYRPVTSLLHALQYALGAGDPLVFRLVSDGLYAAVSWCVWRLASDWLPSGAALAVGLLFAVHPVHVEAVALAAGQAELVVGLLAVLMVRRYLLARRAGTLGLRDWAALAAMYGIAALTKEHGLVLPALLLAAEMVLVLPGQERWRRLLPGYLGLLGVAALVLLLRRAVLAGEVAGTFTAEALEGLGMGARALTMLPVVREWLRLLLFPLHLQGDYSPQELGPWTTLGGPGVLGLGALCLTVAAVVWSWRRAPVVALGLAWTAIALLPVSNVLVPTGILLAERTLFLPSVGFLLAIGGLAARWPRPVWLWAAAACVVLGGVRSAERQRVWRNEAFFSVRTVQDAPRSYRAQRAYAEVLYDLGQERLAEAAYHEALRLAPPSTTWRVHNDWARRLRLLEDTPAEARQLEESLRLAPAQEDTRGHLVAAYLLLGRYGDAAAMADSAIARGGQRGVFGALRAKADSAAQAGAAPGSVRVLLRLGPSQAVR